MKKLLAILVLLIAFPSVLIEAEEKKTAKHPKHKKTDSEKKHKKEKPETKKRKEEKHTKTEHTRASTESSLFGGFGGGKGTDPVVGTHNGRPLYRGKLGGRYYLTDSGNKEYVQR